MSKNTVSIYVKGNKGYFGLRIERELENKQHTLYYEKSYESHGTDINAADFKAACEGLRIIGNDPSFANCNIRFYSNLKLHDEVKAGKATYKDLQPEFEKFSNLVKNMTSQLNPEQMPEFFYIIKDSNSSMAEVDNKLQDFKKSHPRPPRP